MPLRTMRKRPGRSVMRIPGLIESFGDNQPDLMLDTGIENDGAISQGRRRPDDWRRGCGRSCRATLRAEGLLGATSYSGRDKHRHHPENTDPMTPSHRSPPSGRSRKTLWFCGTRPASILLHAALYRSRDCFQRSRQCPGAPPWEQENKNGGQDERRAGDSEASVDSRGPLSDGSDD
jgi:hypothetical protein